MISSPMTHIRRTPGLRRWASGAARVTTGRAGAAGTSRTNSSVQIAPTTASAAIAQRHDANSLTPAGTNRPISPPTEVPDT